MTGGGWWVPTRRAFPLACLLAACSSPGAHPDTDASADGADDGAAPSAACGVTRAPAPNLPGSRDPLILARAAVVVGTCIADDGIDRNLANMWAAPVSHGTWWHRTSLQAECLAGAKCGCDALAECLGWNVTASPPESKGPACNGSRWEYCEGTAGSQSCVSVDCTSLGLVCDRVARCAEEAGLACTTPSNAPSCDAAGVTQHCLSGFAGATLVAGADCPAAGLTCAGGKCVGGGVACTGGESPLEGALAPDGRACAGAMLRACVGGQEAMLDCAKSGPGFSCQSVAGKFFCGLASECVPGNLPPGVDPGNVRCEGSTVVFCNAGRIDRVDCRSLGFTGCEVDRSKGRYGCMPND